MRSAWTQATRAIAWGDRSAPTPLATFAALTAVIALLCYPFHWTGNEENYLPLAYHTVVPQLFGPWDAVFDQSRERIVGFWLIGTLVKLVGYPAAHVLLLAATIGLTAWGLARLAEWLGLSAIDAAAGVMLFWLCGQSLMGGEWIIGGEEPKTIAHGLALIAFSAAAFRRWRSATAWFAAAFYMHFLVAGYWLATALCLLVAGGDRRTATRLLVATMLCTIPLAVFAVQGQIGALAVPRPAGMPDADYIYSILRAPHHVAPFAPGGGWRGQALVGLLDSALLGGGAWMLARTAPPRLRALARTVAAVAAFLFIAMAASWVDRDTGHLGKFYLFRPASILLLLAIFGGLAAWRPASIDRPGTRTIPALALLTAFLTTGLVEWRPMQEPRLDPDTRAMVVAVRQRIPRDGVLLLDPATDAHPSMIRALDRPTVIHWKFMPSNPADIYRWWGLLAMRQAVFAGRCDRMPAVVRLLVATPATLPAVGRCGSPLWTNRTYTLIAVRR